MNDFSSHNERARRPPLLNWLIVVTLITIVVALVYLGNYFLGDNDGKRVSWYPLGFSCQALDQQCHATVGLHSGIGLRLRDNGNGTVDAWLGSHGLGNPQYAMRVTNLSLGFSPLENVTLYRDARHFRLDLRSEYCPARMNNWRLEVVVLSTLRNVGTWSDITLPCVQAKPAPVN